MRTFSQIACILLLSGMAFAAGGACPSGNNTIQADGTPSTIANVGVNSAITGGITSCFYADLSSGSDSNDGLSESSGHPLKHIPGMSGCSSTCASTTPTAGEGFIIKGNTTATATTDFNGLQWAWSGNSSHPIYVGVDKSWFANVSGTVNTSGTTITWASGLRAPYACAQGPHCSGDFGLLVSGDSITINGLSCTVAATPALGATLTITVSGCSPGTNTGVTFSYSKWGRPIFNANSSLTQNMFNIGNLNWNIFDDIEIIGMQNNENLCQMVSSTNTRCTQMFNHKWSHTGSSDNIGFLAAQCGTNDMVDHNVVDGGDSTQNTGNGIYSSCAGTIQYNYLAYLVSGVLATFNSMSYTMIENTITSVDGDHCNLMFNFGPASGTSVLVHDVIVRGMICSGGVNFWLIGNQGCTGCTTEAYNDIIEATSASGNVFNIGGHPASGNTGTYNIRNMTVYVGNSGTCMGNGEASPRSTTNFWNLHCIGGSTLCDGTGTTCNNNGGSLLQSIPTATSQGYVAGTLDYSPSLSCTPSTCGTVQNGNNQSSACSGGDTALCTSISYLTYNSNTNTVSLNTTNPAGQARGSTWDTGAYLLGGTSQVATPTFAPVAGTYSNAQTVTISTSTGGATLCYTTDGSTPTANGSGTCTHGTTYSTPVSIPVSTTLQAVGSESGFSDSAVGSAVYVINLPAVNGATQGVTLTNGVVITR